MNPIPFLQASQVRPFLAAMDHIGASSERYLRQAKLPLLVYEDDEAVVPEFFVWEMLDKLAHNEGIKDLGLLVTTLTPPWKAEPEFIGWLQSLPTLWIALTSFCVVARQFSTADQFDVVRKGKHAWFQRYQRRGVPGEHQVELYDLKIMMQLTQLAGGQSWMPPEVYVSKANAKLLSLHEEFQGARIRHSDNITGIAIPISMLTMPLNALANSSGSPPQSLQATSFQESLSAIIATYLKDGKMNIQLAAEMSGLTKRTFQRRLGDLQLDYNTLIDQVRLKQALASLDRPNIPVTEIAYNLGYSAPAHFTRAFRRWTALSPQEYRRRHQLM